MNIQLKKISKQYDKTNEEWALKNINLQIKQGESVAIMGTSGSGKSTLLNILGCIDTATEGEYLLDNKSINLYTEREKAMLRNRVFGFVVQDFALMNHYTVFKNVQLPLCYTKLPKKIQKEKVIKVLKQVGLGDKINRYPTHLSGGQKQRVAIARAIINEAEILLCDEPTGALDSKTTEEIMYLFMELNKQGKTIIIITHDDKVANYCDRIIELNDGKIVTDGDNLKM